MKLYPYFSLALVKRVPDDYNKVNVRTGKHHTREEMRVLGKAHSEKLIVYGGKER